MCSLKYVKYGKLPTIVCKIAFNFKVGGTGGREPGRIGGGRGTGDGRGRAGGGSSKRTGSGRAIQNGEFLYLLMP